MGSVSFADMVCSEVKVERGMKRARDSSSDEVSPTDAILEVSKIVYFFTIKRS